MRRVSVAMAVALMCAACASEETAAPTPAATVTETASVPAAVPSQPSTPSQSSPEQTPVPAPAVAAGVIPDVVGVNHQLAQDSMQAAGFYNLSEEDASGTGRMLISDRGWEVVSQEPPAGTKASSDITIILRSKRIGE